MRASSGCSCPFSVSFNKSSWLKAALLSFTGRRGWISAAPNGGGSGADGCKTGAFVATAARAEAEKSPLLLQEGAAVGRAVGGAGGGMAGNEALITAVEGKEPEREMG